MDRDNKIVVGLTIATLAVIIFFGVFPDPLSYFGGPSSFFTPFVQIIPYIFAVSLSITVVVIVFRRRKRIQQSLGNRYIHKLENKIKNELEAVAKNRDYFYIDDFTNQLRNNIIGRLPPIPYFAVPSERTRIGQKGQYTEIANKLLPISLGEGKIFAEKLTEISSSRRYRRNKALFLLIP